MAKAFKDQVAVVTGASSGVGRAIVLALAAEEARVCLVGRQVTTLASVIDEAQICKGNLSHYRCDLTWDSDIRELASQLQREHTFVDVLVHSAGVISLGRLEDASLSDFDWHYRTNVRAPYLLTQTLLPMLRRRQGQIVFINSSVARTARAKIGQYAATKRALAAVADSLREELNQDGIRVVTIFLGRTATPMQKEVHRQEGRSYRPECLIQPDDVANVVVSTLKLPRTVEVTEISMRPFTKIV
jgi:NADP-dependent 3-hydroxy acid dehydrogenase YdfG